nr:hypothetical protein BaRGS_012289 [Batillaria attramentaria]
MAKGPEIVIWLLRKEDGKDRRWPDPGHTDLLTAYWAGARKRRKKNGLATMERGRRAFRDVSARLGNVSSLLWEKPAAHVKNKSRRHYRHQHPQHETDNKERQSQKTPNWPKRDNNRDNHHHGEGSNYIRQGQQHRRTRYQPRRPYRNHHAGLNQQDDHNRGNDYHRHHDPRQDQRRGRQYYTAYHQDHWDHRERRSSNTWQDDRWNDWHSYRDPRHGGQSKYW